MSLPAFSNPRAPVWGFVITLLGLVILLIAPIFGTDLTRPDLVQVVGRRLEGLLGGDPRAYLAAQLARS